MRALTLLAFICILACAYSQSHDLNVGKRQSGDVALYKVNEYKYAIPLLTRTSLIAYPPPEQRNYGVITAIYVKDEYNDGRGGYAEISDGGLGYRSTEISLQSQWNHGFNFTITIYGNYGHTL